MANEIAKKPEEKNLKTVATNIANYYLTDLANLNNAVGFPLDDESRRLGQNLIMQLVSDLGAEDVKKLDSAQIINALQFVTINGLDIFSGQVFIDKRWNSKKGRYDIKALPQGSAYEIMVKRFGIDVKTVHQAHVVHEGDEFTMPQYEGLKVTPITFSPSLAGQDKKAIAVYYIIEKNDGSLDYAIATRDGVAKNLMAQITNNALKDANTDRSKLFAKMDGKTLDELIADPEFQTLINPTYRNPAARESMIIQKMKKNALLHYTRDLGAKANTAAEAMEKADSSDMVVSVQNGTPESPKTKQNPSRRLKNPRSWRKPRWPCPHP